MDTDSAPGRDGRLTILGLRPGEEIRWRPAGGGRWRVGTVSRCERDGSIGVHDRSGAARSLPVEAIRVARPGPRGGSGWEPLAERAGRCEQLTLWELREPLRRSERGPAKPSAGRGRKEGALRGPGS